MSPGYSNIKLFINDDFLLENEEARILYNEYACKQPIIDYHNHLPPDRIANNSKFNSITDVWLSGDHYKWRAMRALGIKEKYITGNSSSKEKFLKWAEAVPHTMRNPLFHWTHLELKRYFGIDELLHERSADKIFNQCNELLKEDRFSTLGLLKRMNVEVLCTTDDPIDDLLHHSRFQESGSKMKFFPAFRPDRAILIGSPGYLSYLNQLEEAANQSILTFEDLISALNLRMKYFDSLGCRISDHGISMISTVEVTESKLKTIFKKRRSGLELDPKEIHLFTSGILVYLAKKYSELGWTMQLHLGALRNVNSRMINTLGPDTGFDSIGGFNIVSGLAKFLDTLDKDNSLPKTIIYNLNPADNAAFASMIGNFYEEGIRSKVQYGSAWWFLDQKDGIKDHLNTLSNMSLLTTFIGMLTDSRSFLSFPRHEYFRRVLCNIIGKDVERGMLPKDLVWLGKMVENICYFNAKDYFQFKADD